VGVDGAAPPAAAPFSTYLAGQRLAKLIEAGYMPVSIAATLASVRIWASCVTGYLMEGTGMGLGMGMSGGGRPREVEQVAEAHTAVRRIARERVRHQVGGDSLHGATLDVSERAFSEGDELVEAVLRGTRVRRFRDFAALAPPRPTVRLS